MTINKVHCLFEQSGTFKTAFRNLGYEAYDYDIQNIYKQTDYQVDLFKEIEEGWTNDPSIFDNITKDDLIMAFFPCIYFESMSQMYFSFDSLNLKHLSRRQQYKVVLERIEKRNEFLKILYKLCGIVETRGLRMILENPASNPQYLLFAQNFVKPPTFIDKNRLIRGDYYKKPTAYWFFNCEQTYGESYNNNTPKVITNVMGNKSGKGGVCNMERSEISPEYAKNFIADFVLGITNENTTKNLFD